MSSRSETKEMSHSSQLTSEGSTESDSCTRRYASFVEMIDPSFQEYTPKPRLHVAFAGHLLPGPLCEVWMVLEGLLIETTIEGLGSRGEVQTSGVVDKACASAGYVRACLQRFPSSSSTLMAAPAVVNVVKVERSENARQRRWWYIDSSTVTSSGSTIELRHHYEGPGLGDIPVMINFPVPEDEREIWMQLQLQIRENSDGADVDDVDDKSMKVFVAGKLEPAKPSSTTADSSSSTEVAIIISNIRRDDEGLPSIMPRTRAELILNGDTIFSYVQKEALARAEAEAEEQDEDVEQEQDEEQDKKQDEAEAEVEGGSSAGVTGATTTSSSDPEQLLPGSSAGVVEKRSGSMASPSHPRPRFWLVKSFIMERVLEKEKETRKWFNAVVGRYLGLPEDKKSSKLHSLGISGGWELFVAREFDLPGSMRCVRTYLHGRVDLGFLVRQVTTAGVGESCCRDSRATESTTKSTPNENVDTKGEEEIRPTDVPIGVFELKRDSEFNDGKYQLGVYLAAGVAPGVRCILQQNERKFHGCLVSPSHGALVSLEVTEPFQQWKLHTRHLGRKTWTGGCIEEKYVSSSSSSSSAAIIEDYFVGVVEMFKSLGSFDACQTWFPPPVNSAHLQVSKDYHRELVYKLSSEDNFKRFQDYLLSDDVGFENILCNNPRNEDQISMENRVIEGAEQCWEEPQLKRVVRDISLVTSAHAQSSSPGDAYSVISTFPSSSSSSTITGCTVSLSVSLATTNPTMSLVTTSGTVTTTAFSRGSLSTSVGSSSDCYVAPPKYVVKWINTLTTDKTYISLVAKKLLGVVGESKSLYRAIYERIPTMNVVVVMKYSGLSLRDWLRTEAKAKEFREAWSLRATRENFRTNVCVVLTRMLLEKKCSHTDVRLANICARESSNTSTKNIFDFIIIDWDNGLVDVTSNEPIDMHEEDGRYLGLTDGYHGVLLMSQIILVCVF